LLATGKYGSFEELLVEALRTLSDREGKIYQGRFDELRHEVRIGID
jgi:DNA-directed RNA polymerase specialized sigma subunit